MKHACLKQFSKKSQQKRIDVDRFYGIDVGSFDIGRIIDCDNVSVLSGGALRSLLAESQIKLGESPSLEGIYTYCQYYDASYEIKTTPDFIYKNVCPKNVLNYTHTVDVASRIFISQNGYKGKTAEGYSNVLASFIEEDTVYVLYDATCTIIDQRRNFESNSVDNGLVVQFECLDENVGEWACIYNLTQIWLDVIKDGKVVSKLIDAKLKKRKNLTSTVRGKSTMFSEDWGKTCRYLSPEYLPNIMGSFNLSYDKVYRDIYPNLASYSPEPAKKQNGQLVRYRNRIENAEEENETFVFLPDMTLISESNSEWSTTESSMPAFDGAVQHFERLFGFKDKTLYASVKGDCTDFTEGVDNLPPSAAWKTVTHEKSGFTAIASFDGKVVVFTDKSMMTVKGVDLPFSLTYIGAYGCKSPASVIVDGGNLYFASHSGILCYNGSSVRCISRSLPRDLKFEDAKLSFSKGILIAEFESFKGFYLYSTGSESWTYQKGDYVSSVIPMGDGGAIMRKTNGGYKLYRTFSKESDFAFSVIVSGGVRKRIMSVSVTASVNGGSLSLVDENKDPIFTVEDTGGRVVTRNCVLKNAYGFKEALDFCGSGNVTLYSVSLEYLPIKNRLFSGKEKK